MQLTHFVLSGCNVQFTIAWLDLYVAAVSFVKWYIVRQNVSYNKLMRFSPNIGIDIQYKQMHDVDTKLK